MLVRFMMRINVRFFELLVLQAPPLLLALLPLRS